MLRFDDFSKTLTGTSDELRAKPSNGISEMGKTLVDAVVDLRAFQECGLLGDGMNGLLAALEGKQAAFDVLNSFGSEVSRSHDHVKAAATDVVEVLHKLVQKEEAKDLVCDIRQMAVRLAHLAQWLQSGMSAVGNPEEYAASVPRHGEQHGHEALHALAKKPSKKALIAFWTKALTDKGQSAASSPKTKTKRSYGSFTLDDAEEVDDVEEDGDDVKAAPAKKSKKAKKADVDEDDDDVEAAPAKKAKKARKAK